jgi:hypothetical protein
MAEQTKEDLLKRVAELEEQVARQQDSIKRLSTKGEGWLITAPNPLFDGQIFGVQFVNGQAFIRKAQVVQHFVFEPLKDTTIAKYNYPPAEVAAIREREKRSSAELAAMAMQTDFGYLVEYYDAEHLTAIQDKIDQRLGQRMQAEELQAQQEQAQMLSLPAYRR